MMKYAFIVGKGGLVDRILDNAKQHNIDFVVAAIKGVTSRTAVNKYEHFWFYLGQVSKLLEQLKANKVTHIILLGAVKRPSLFALRIDKLGSKLIKQYLQNIKGDDSLLKIVVRLLEDHNFIVHGVQEIDNSIFAKPGLLTDIKPDKDNLKDINVGYSFAKEFSKFDIGQSIVFQQGMVVAVEAVEGTDKLIKRSKNLIKKSNPKAILIKIKKIHQDIRVDLPTIGTGTIKLSKKSGLAGIVIDTNTIILNQVQTVALANKLNLFILVK